MSDINTHIAFDINKELIVNTREEAISENLWIIGVSKTHPGLKYYFNTVTGVSLWNISKEDMERAKQTMTAHGSQAQYINCPEPKEPPPNKRAYTNLPAQLYCEHISRRSKTYNKQFVNNALARETSGFACDVCCAAVNSPPNVITVNFRPCSHPTCISPLDTACTTVPQSQLQSSTMLSETSTLEKNHCIKNQNHLLGSKRLLNRSIADIMVDGPSNEQSHNRNNTDSEYFNHNASQFGTLDLTSLKIFTNNGVIRDKWYIVADANVYLHHINFLKTVVNSDSQCCLMVPQNVKIELENATKTELRTKAHCASYFIYKMYDCGLAYIEENSSKHLQGKCNEEHILHCCSKLKEQNLYVVVISNDLELQKYRNKIQIPIFTVEQLKEYLCKSNNCVRTRSPVSTYKAAQSIKNIETSTPNYSSILTNTTTITNPNDALKQNSHSIQTLLMDSDVGARVQTADAEAQSNCNSTQLEKFENIYKRISLPTQNNDIPKKKDVPISNTQSCEPLPNSSIQGPRKRIKLRRKKISDGTVPNPSTKHVIPTESHVDISDNIGISPLTNNLLFNKKIEKLNNGTTNMNHTVKPDEITIDSTLNTKTEENDIVLNNTLKPVQAKLLQFNTHHENSENKNVMFEVTTELMEHSLRRKCDEWVSRFVQIMEEALTQVLTKNSSLYLPPPWNMYEAAICIEKRFNNDEDVVDASKKFLNILNRICDAKGNINANISPTQYMEMYSFGVYMIDALQGIFITCEDLQTAAESLSKLLSDIQDPESDIRNLEISPCISQEENIINDTDSSNDVVEVLMIIDTESLSNERSPEETESRLNVIEATSENDVSNDNFERSKSGSQFSLAEISNKSNPIQDYMSENCNLREAVNIECNEKSQKNIINTCTEAKTTCSTVSVASSNGYNLRSRLRRISSEKQQFSPKYNKMIGNDISKSTFLSNFLLHKTALQEKHYSEESINKNIITENIFDHVGSSPSERTSKRNSYHLNKNDADFAHKVNTISKDPKVVRNFVICSEFEDRLRNRHLYDEMEEFDFEDEPMATDCIGDEESSCDTGRLQIDEFAKFDDNADVDHGMTKKTENLEMDFKYFIRRFAQEIKELSTEIYSFSQNSCDAINSLSNANDKRHGIQKRAEQVYLYMDKLCKALTNILNRDRNGAYSVQALFRQTEFDIISLDDVQMEAYRAFVSRCLDQAHDLKNTIKDVLAAVY